MFSAYVTKQLVECPDHQSVQERLNVQQPFHCAFSCPFLKAPAVCRISVHSFRQSTRRRYRQPPCTSRTSPPGAPVRTITRCLSLRINVNPPFSHSTARAAGSLSARRISASVASSPRPVCQYGRFPSLSIRLIATTTN